MTKQPRGQTAHARKQPGRSRIAAREFSAGGIVVKQREGKWWIAVIEPAGRRSGKRKSSGERDGSGRAVLALPKGNVDPGESPEQAAVREVREETGLDADILTKLGDSKYVYVRAWGDGARVFKVVSFYLLRYRSGRLGNLPPETRHEVAKTHWIELEDAPRRLSYKGDREMAMAALDFLNSKPAAAIPG